MGALRPRWGWQRKLSCNLSVIIYKTCVYALKKRNSATPTNTFFPSLLCYYSIALLCNTPEQTDKRRQVARPSSPRQPNRQPIHSTLLLHAPIRHVSTCINSAYFDIDQIRSDRTPPSTLRGEACMTHYHTCMVMWGLVDRDATLLSDVADFSSLEELR